MKSMRLSFLILVVSVLLAACASTGSQQPGAESGGGAAQQGATAPEGAATPIGEGAQTQQGQMDELQNPNSPLAQRTIYFDFDKSEIKPEYFDVLTAHAKYLIAHPNVHIRLEGNTDERGSREYNIALGDRRAQAVRRFLLFQGVSADQITTVSYGEEHPVDPGHNEAAWAKNRRVDIVYLQ